MTVIVAVAYLTGVAIGLHLHIRMIISATMFTLFACLASALVGWMSIGQSAFAAFATIAALQAGYVSIVILNAVEWVDTDEKKRSVRPPSASDNPSHQ